MITYEYDLDVTPGGTPICVNLSQYDQDYELKFRLYSRQGFLEIKQGTTVSIRGTKKDGKGYSVDAAINEYEVTVYGDKQMTAVAGRQNFELRLLSDGRELNTANFFIVVERAPMDKDTVESISVVKEFENAAELAGKMIECAEKAKNDATASANIAASMSENAAVSANAAAESALAAGQKAGESAGWSDVSRSWAEGRTGVREGEDTNNSKFYSEQSESSANRAEEAAAEAEMYAGIMKPEFHLDPETMILYARGGAKIDFIVADNCELCWKII